MEGHGEHFKGGAGDTCKITGAASKNKHSRQRQTKRETQGNEKYIYKGL
jgi:hypothetical protein